MSPSDRYLTVHGRKPVLEALQQGRAIARIHLSERGQGPVVGEILDLARQRDVVVERVSEKRLAALARSGQHQGVVADVRAPRLQTLLGFLEQRTGRQHATTLLVLDRVHNPANLGMILRSATAAGIDGIVVPEAGTADIGPVAIKASAGVAFQAPILRVDRVEYAMTQLVDARFAIVALDAGGDSIFEAVLGDRLALVVGNETEGLSAQTRAACTQTVSLPLANGVESLNVAAAATVAVYELMRRRATR